MKHALSDKLKTELLKKMKNDSTEVRYDDSESEKQDSSDDDSDESSSIELKRLTKSCNQVVDLKEPIARATNDSLAIINELDNLSWDSAEEYL